ncbi:MAG: cupredoxin domain-containing protein [Burkholderiales bacterium]|nr:cupredoxin domain-containing protein [Burkholderiales bacterium]
MGIDLQRRRLLATSAIGLASASAFVAAQPAERTIAIVARKFEYLPAEIKVRQGETIVLQLTAPEVAMGFYLATYALRVDIMPGKVSTLRLTADKPGRFEFSCDVFCGSGHEEMAGLLIVE